MKSELDRIEYELTKAERFQRLSTNPKYNRGRKFEHQIKPNWKAMEKSLRANTSRRTSTLIVWCDKHCKGSYSYDGMGTGFSFQLSSDAMLFKLTWG